MLQYYAKQSTILTNFNINAFDNNRVVVHILLVIFILHVESTLKLIDLISNKRDYRSPSLI